MNCPVCESKRYTQLKSLRLDQLGNEWSEKYGFNPVKTAEAGGVLLKFECAHCGLHFYNNNLPGDGSFYEKLSKFPWYYEEEKWEFDAAIKVISEHDVKSVLEIGSGAGCFLDKAVNMMAYVEGVDINPAAIAICKAKGLNVRLSDAATGELNNSKPRYDCIVLFEVLEHLLNPLSYLDKMVNLLNGGGLLILAVPNPESYLKEIGSALLDMPPHHYFGWNERTFRYIAGKYELNLIGYQKEPIRYVHYQAYLNNLAGQYFSSTPNEWTHKIAHYFIRGLVIPALAPFFYAQHQEKLAGQTHMAVFRKT